VMAPAASAAVAILAVIVAIAGVRGEPTQKLTESPRSIAGSAWPSLPAWLPSPPHFAPALKECSIIPPGWASYEAKVSSAQESLGAARNTQEDTRRQLQAMHESRELLQAIGTEALIGIDSVHTQLAVQAADRDASSSADHDDGDRSELLRAQKLFTRAEARVA